MCKVPPLITMALVALLLASACGDGGEPAATPTPRPTATPTGCDPARPQAAGDFDQTIDSGGLTRRYILHIPPSYSDTGGADATPLVLLLHGSDGNAKEIAGYTGLPAKADRAGFIAVMPQTPEHLWNFTTLGLEPGDPDDVAFIDDLLDALEAELCIDSARVFSTGFSAGAHMSVRLACDLSDRIAAIAPVAGVYFPPFSPLHIPEPGCLSTQPVPVIAFHGTADMIVPFEGGERFGGRRSIDDEHMPGWAAHNGCASVPMEEQVTQNVRLVRYEECDEGATVELYAIDGGGHQWADPTFDLPLPNFGTVTHEISANDLMWDFFEAHPLSAAPEAATAPTATTTATPAAGKIAFVSGRDGNFEVYVMNADGSGQTNLTNNPDVDFLPAWSPDGSRIAFESARDGNPGIYVMNADGSGQTRLTDNPGDLAPAWSPDGSRIAFTSDRDGNNEIYVMNSDGSGQTRFTDNPADDGLAAWSPDGSRIAFTSDRDGNFEVYVMNADGSGQTRLTDNPAFDGVAAWSPDGSRIAFNSDRDGNPEVYVINADGSNQTRLTNNPAFDVVDPAAWSPDGSRIAFTSTRDDGNFEVYVMNADGSGLTNLTNNPAFDGLAAWSPAP